MENNERKLDAIVYIVSLCLSAFRFSQGLPAFDFDSVASAEYLLARCMPFILNRDEDFEVAHKSFILDLLQNGWKVGSENIDARTSPDLIVWSELPPKSKEMVAYIAAMTTSAQSFYDDLVAELQEELITNLNSIIVKGKSFKGLQETTTVQ